MNRRGTSGSIGTLWWAVPSLLYAAVLLFKILLSTLRLIRSSGLKWWPVSHKKPFRGSENSTTLRHGLQRPFWGLLRISAFWRLQLRMDGSTRRKDVAVLKKAGLGRGLVLPCHVFIALLFKHCFAGWHKLGSHQGFLARKWNETSWKPWSYTSIKILPTKRPNDRVI